ncbi:MAG: helix-turn-helix transcriptional regulator [Clostridia bacterium]|jgi:transcriptional regulator with XRE-family HTH domain|nr:helix-turn-helix transcriptional regulator [Clostridia bacterium]
MALDYKLMGDRLKKARIQKGYTQEKLAETLDVSIAYISRIETGKTHINLKRLNEICTVLETSESYILNGASENSKSYLSSEFSSILNDCSSKDKELIYQIATIISENKNKTKED